jgi:transcriptional regulator with XRE-family HTH domain
MNAYDGLVMARPSSKQPTFFGSRLAQARKEAGLTQTQLAEILHVSQQMIDYYERRASNPTATFIQKAAKILNVSVDNLLGHEVQNTRKSGPPSLLEQRLLAIRRLPRERQKLLLEILDTFLRNSQHANGHKRAA